MFTAEPSKVWLYLHCLSLKNMFLLVLFSFAYRFITFSNKCFKQMYHPHPSIMFHILLTQLQIRFPCGASILPAQFSSSSCCRGLVLSRPVLSCHPVSTPFAAFLDWIPVSWASCLPVSWFTPSFCWSISSNTFRKKEHKRGKLFDPLCVWKRPMTHIFLPRVHPVL